MAVAVFVVVTPGASALVTTWALGRFAITFGVMLSALGWEAYQKARAPRPVRLSACRPDRGRRTPPRDAHAVRGPVGRPSGLRPPENVPTAPHKEAPSAATTGGGNPSRMSPGGGITWL
jgi:hypothetical protein